MTSDDSPIQWAQLIGICILGLMLAPDLFYEVAWSALGIVALVTGLKDMSGGNDTDELEQPA